MDFRQLFTSVGKRPKLHNMWLGKFQNLLLGEYPLLRSKVFQDFGMFRFLSSSLVLACGLWSFAGAGLSSLFEMRLHLNFLRPCIHPPGKIRVRAWLVSRVLHGFRNMCVRRTCVGKVGFSGLLMASFSSSWEGMAPASSEPRPSHHVEKAWKSPLRTHAPAAVAKNAAGSHVPPRPPSKDGIPWLRPGAASRDSILGRGVWGEAGWKIVFSVGRLVSVPMLHNIMGFLQTFCKGVFWYGPGPFPGISDPR